MKQGANARPRVCDDVIVERLPGETLVYDQATDTAHCLSDAAATVFELCDGTRTPPALATLTAKRLDRAFDETELDAVLAELRSKGLLDGPAAEGVSRRQVMLAGGATAAAALITTIVAPLPAAAQSATPPGGGTAPGTTTGDPGDPCQSAEDCNEGLQCQEGNPNDTCCSPSMGNCSTGSDCCGFGPGRDVFCNENGRCDSS